MSNVTIYGVRAMAVASGHPGELVIGRGDAPDLATALIARLRAYPVAKLAAFGGAVDALARFISVVFLRGRLAVPIAYFELLLALVALRVVLASFRK